MVADSVSVTLRLHSRVPTHKRLFPFMAVLPPDDAGAHTLQA
jgi:hypothetical protein